MVLNGVFIIKLVLFWCFGASTSSMFILRGNSRTFRSSGMLLKGVLMKKLVELLLCGVWCGEIWMCDVWCGVMRCACDEMWMYDMWCGVVSHPALWWDVNVWYVMWCGEPSGPRTRPKNFFLVFSSFGLWCVMWWDVMSDVWWDAMMCDVWCGEISSIRAKNSAQELLLCVLFFRLVMCDVVRFRLSGPRTRPKNFFFVFSSFGLWCVMWWDVMSDVWWDAMMCDVWCGEISSIRAKNSAQELLLCVLFFRLVMCDVVRFRLSGPRTRPKNFFGEISSFRPKNSAQELLLCVLFFRLVMCGVVRCDVWWLVRWCSHIVVTHSAHTWCSHSAHIESSHIECSRIECAHIECSHIEGSHMVLTHSGHT